MYYTTGQPDLVSIMKKNRTRFKKGYSLTTDTIDTEEKEYTFKPKQTYTGKKETYRIYAKDILDLALVQLKREQKITLNDIKYNPKKVASLIFIMAYTILNIVNKNGQTKMLNDFLKKANIDLTN